MNCAVNKRVTLKLLKLEELSVRFVGFSDALFFNNEDLTAQLGHIWFLCDMVGKAVQICFKSFK